MQTTPFQAMIPHDNAYKNIFSQPEIIADLLKGFVRETWVEQLDFEGFKKESASYVTEHLSTREDDLVWRIRLQGAESEWIYVCILLEFQRSVDTHMAARLLTYVGLLYEELIKSKEFLGRKLPGVFPIVVYSGQTPWRAKLNISELIETMPQSLEAYCPSMRYFLLDEGRVAEAELDDGNTVASLVRLERCDSTEAIDALTLHLGKTLAGTQNTRLRRAFTVFIRKIILPRFAPTAELLKFDQIHDLMELHTMIEERAPTWAEKMMQQGMQQGMQPWRNRGMVHRRFICHQPRCCVCQPLKESASHGLTGSDHLKLTPHRQARLQYGCDLDGERF
jgi:predicted transposase/invertase (TIGR01784 family)